MSKTSVVRARIEPKLKQEVEEILSELGISFSEAINIFAAQIKITNGIPFEIKRAKKPNKETIEAMFDIKNEKDLLVFDGKEYLENFKNRSKKINETNQRK
ncbi:MAG: type II toxin-antitoxin system RelB/DinJ family antitoxin [Candidatus Sericytochromatia bacterium]|nr:type II toxin-antitoxin system RelB/DinJ family antitoxin [Candidatus Sericytochromatia bacterium]